MAGVTYRFHVRAERSDGAWSVVQESAAVYNTAEEALVQAGTDMALGANVWPVDVVDGEHHGYDVTAFGQPANHEEAPSITAAQEFEEPKVIADTAVIVEAAAIVQEIWIDNETPNPTVGAPRVTLVSERKLAGKPDNVDKQTWRSMVELDVATAETHKRMRALL